MARFGAMTLEEEELQCYFEYKRKCHFYYRLSKSISLLTAPIRGIE
ncbi:MAG: hypothetical protein ACFFBH_07110 [Promethearchaeota archaeon]